MSFAFLDFRCPECQGDGCDNCDGMGIVGTFAEVPTFTEIRLSPTAWSLSFQWSKAKRRMTLREIMMLTGIPASRLSALEHGHDSPTMKERAAIGALVFFALPEG